MSECIKCGYDPDRKILNEMMAASKCYNTASEPSWIAERAVPLNEAVRIALKYSAHTEDKKEKL